MVLGEVDEIMEEVGVDPIEIAFLAEVVMVMGELYLVLGTVYVIIREVGIDL